MSDLDGLYADEHLHPERIEFAEDGLTPMWHPGEHQCEPAESDAEEQFICPVCGRHWELDVDYRIWDPLVMAEAYRFQRGALLWAGAVKARELGMPLEGHDDGR